MGPRYPGGPKPGSVRMPQMGPEFGGPPGQPMMSNSLDPTRFEVGLEPLTVCCCCSTSLLLDPLEAKCGHFFCRGCITELLTSSTDERAPLCGVCQSTVCKNYMKDLSPKTSKLTSTLQHFIQVFCEAEGWRIDTVLSSVLMFNKIKGKTVVSKTTAANFEDGSDSIIICSSSPSELAHQSTLEPKHKVHQWLANPSVDPLAVTSEEDDSFESTKRLSTPVTISSTGKESTYDIVSAPSPPPSREIPQQMKRGRGGRGRGRTRKNALPISSGEALARKSGRSAGNTPEMKEIAVKTPTGKPNFSPEFDGALNTSSIAPSSTPLTHCSIPFH
uniref:RING-type domain-containing protein n=1 Tax=Daphnia galeata TaxID=27404 RepID=A0A8J2WHL5_9CRUS|nr:unnamed protein product [Daphnia galeata]